jgi:hypothetical protein
VKQADTQLVYSSPILKVLKLYNLIYKNPPLISVMSQVNPFHTLRGCSFKIFPIILLPGASYEEEERNMKYFEREYY